MRDNLVKVTTTSGFDGVPIDEYMEPVTAHIVVGMNFFKDFFVKNFNERCQRTTKKKILSAKEKDIWICECGKENDQEDSTCKNCNKDPTVSIGLRRSQMN